MKRHVNYVNYVNCFRIFQNFINSVKFTKCDTIVKINSAKLSFLEPAKRENLLRKNF